MTQLKIEILERINHIDDEKFLSSIKAFLDNKNGDSEAYHTFLYEPMEQFLDIEKIRLQQGYKKTNPLKVAKILNQINIEEPIELLLSQLSK